MTYELFLKILKKANELGNKDWLSVNNRGFAFDGSINKELIESAIKGIENERK